MALSKVAEASLLDIQSVASNSFVVGAAKDVSAALTAGIRIRMGRGTANAFSTAAPSWRLEGTGKASPTANDWNTIAGNSAALGASIGSQAVSGTEAIGQTVVTLAAGTNFAAGDFVFFHNTTIENSEWKRVASVSGADLTLYDALVFAQTGATCRDQAEEWGFTIDCLPWQNIRLVIDALSSGQASIWAAQYALGAL